MKAHHHARLTERILEMEKPRKENRNIGEPKFVIISQRSTGNKLHLSGRWSQKGHGAVIGHKNTV